MSEVRQQLLITLVHGTWPRGLFPRIVRFKHWVRALVRRQPRGPLIFWFEEGSPFLARLGTELGDVPHKITPLLWSGANSIFVRDKTAQVLAEHLSGEHAQHPQATQLVIAHSHGGNIALRALHHLKQGKASPSCVESVNPLVVTLGTPFMEVHPADFGRRPFYIRVALTIFVMGPILFLLLGLLGWFLSLIFVPLEPLLPVLVAGTPFLVLIMGRWWVVWRAPARQNQLVALEDATRLSGLWSTQRLLVIRAIDDEASLTLSLGAILNYLAARSIAVVLLFLFGAGVQCKDSPVDGVVTLAPEVASCFRPPGMFSFDNYTVRLAVPWAIMVWPRTRRKSPGVSNQYPLHARCH